jgi:hypothetical protein
MDPALFEQLESTLQTKGASAAIEALCYRLKADRQYDALFYALLMKKRHELGVLPIPTGPSQDLPVAAHAPYEEAIRESARRVGELYLKDGEIGRAWVFFRMIEDPGPVREALEKLEPEPEQDIQPLVQVAFYEGVLPTKGFDWILARYGLCSAITTLGGQELPFPDEVKHYCVKLLVRTLSTELRSRLLYEIEAREGHAPPGADAPPDRPGVLPKLIEGRDWLFADEVYHIDLSHLSSVVQMATLLPRCPELDLARDLCVYGRKLSPRLVPPGEPPFDSPYLGYGAYLAVLAGDQVEENLAYFRGVVDNFPPEEVGTYPAETLVNLLLRIDRPKEALAVARRHLAAVANQRLTCPNINELCHRLGDFQTLAEVAREQGDPVHFVAGMLAAKK